MKISHIILTVAIAAIVAIAAPRITGGGDGAKSGATETAFERVLRTNTLRCGYYTYPPFMIRDPNTGKLSGISVDMMDYVAQKTGLKIEWTEEVTFGNWVPALQSRRFDASCTPMWPDAAQRRVVMFTQSMLFSAIYPFIRLDETRFHGDWHEMDKPEIKIVVQEGNVTEGLAHEWFPHATFVSQPPSADYGMLIQDVIDKKADVVLWDLNGFAQYEKKNPGHVKMLKLSKPLKIMPFEIPVLQGEVGLWAFLNGVLEDMINTGTLGRILEKWENVPGAYLYPAQTYSETR